MIDGIFNFASTVINKLFPDKSDQEKQRLINELALATQAYELTKGQQEINKVEAQHSSIFVAGGRPFILWVCGFIFAYHYLIYPMITSIAAVSGVDVSHLPKFDLSEIWPVLGGLLGLGAFRSYEKVRGVAR